MTYMKYYTVVNISTISLAMLMKVQANEGDLDAVLEIINEFLGERRNEAEVKVGNTRQPKNTVEAAYYDRRYRY